MMLREFVTPLANYDDEPLDGDSFLSQSGFDAYAYYINESTAAELSPW